MIVRKFFKQDNISVILVNFNYSITGISGCYLTAGICASNAQV